MSLEDSQSSDHELHDYSEHDVTIARELIETREAKKRIEYKYQLLKQRYEEELTTFDEAKVENIFKNSGAREHIENLNERIRLKDKEVKGLRKQVDRLENDVDNWTKRFNKSREVYRKSLREYQAKIDRLLQMSNREQSINSERMLNDTSSALSFDSIPDPPPIEMPSINEILNMVQSPQVNDERSYTSANNSHFASLDQLDSSIPPPPHINVTLDEILGGLSSPQGSVCNNERRY